MELFAAAGWRTMQTDAIARGFLERDASVHAALRQRWGDVVINAVGVVDRQAIAARVFTDSEELEWLESLLHPMVRSAWQQALAAEPDANWLVEIPLLFEKRLESAFDLTVCVICPSDVVETRMLSRGYSKAQVEQRQLRQMPLEQKAKLADRVITNAGSLEFLKRQTYLLIEDSVN